MTDPNAITNLINYSNDIGDDFANFTLKLGGKDDLSATTYSAILINTVVLLEETNKELKTNAHLDIRVKSERAGSFLIDLGIEPAVLGGIAPLLTTENVKLVKTVASSIIDTASKALDVWKSLKGEKPKEIEHKGETVIVITGNDNKIEIDKSVYNIALTNKRSQEAITNTFKALKDDEVVTDFSYIDSQKETKFIAERSDFTQLGKPIPIIVEETRKSPVSATLRVVKQSFDKALKSDYLYLGNRIVASNSDDSFWEKIEEGERFGKGDALVVVLEITKEYNKSLNAYENKGYSILKVESHTPRDEGIQDLFDSE
jgi:hypothetical protein